MNPDQKEQGNENTPEKQQEQTASPPDGQQSAPEGKTESPQVAGEPTSADQPARSEDQTQNTPSTSQQPTEQSAQESKKKGPLKKLSALSVGLMVAGLLIAGSAAAYFGYILPNRPENIFKSALENSAKAYNGLIDYSEEQKDIKGANIEGNFSLTGQGMSGDLNVNGSFYEGQGQGTVDFGFAGTRYDAEIRAVEVENSDYPDLYAKVNGIEGLGALLGAQSGSNGTGQFIDSLDGQWIFIDHTALEGAVSQAQSAQGQGQPELTNEEAITIARKVGETNEQYLFSTDEETAVFTIAEKVGKEDFEGRETYKFLVNVNKENLKTYVENLKENLRDSKLPELTGDDYDSSFDELIDEIESSEVDQQDIEVWVDTGTKTVRNVRFVEEDNENNVLDVSLLYEGGDTYPLRFKANNEGTESTVTFTLNTATDEFTFSADFSDESGVEGDGSMTISPRNEPVDVQTPDDAMSINELIGSFYGSGSSGGATPGGDFNNNGSGSFDGGGGSLQLEDSPFEGFQL